MARSLIDIQNSIVATIKNQNVAYDVSKGPIYDTIVAPLREEIYEEELSIDDIRKLLTYRFSDAVTDEEALSFAASFGISRPQGHTSKGKGVLYTYVKPTQDLLAEKGMGLTTTNNLYNFIVTQEKYMLLENINAYYNATNGRYELQVEIESVGKGYASELPIGTVNTINYGGEAWEGFINTTEITGSTEDATNTQLINIVKDKFSAHNDSGSWLEYDIISQFPTVIADVQRVSSKDRDLFTRFTNRPALDFYIYGAQYDSEEYSFTAQGGEQNIYLSKLPVYSVTDVFVNNYKVTYSYVEPNDQYKGSTRSSGYLKLDYPLTAGDFVRINYTYNTVLYSLQKIYDDPDQELLFDTDVLFREFNTVGIDIVLSLKIAKNYNDMYIKQEAASYVNDFIDDSARSEFILPTTLKDLIRESIPGILGINVPVFRKEINYMLNSEPIELTRIEVAILNTLNINTYTN